MVVVDYVDVLKGCADLCGLDRDNLSTKEETILRNVLLKHLYLAWRRQKWPDLCRIEKRYFRDVYASATAYVAGNEVYFAQTQKYYQALTSTTGTAPADSAGNTNTTRWGLCQTVRSAPNYDASKGYVAGDIVYDPSSDAFYQAIASSTGVAVSDTSKWGVFNDYSRYVSKDQPGKTPVGTVWDVWDADRRATAAVSQAEWYRSNLGVQVVSDIPFVWLEFRLREPLLSGTTYSASATYAVGDQIYFTDGNFWTCVTATSAGESPVSAASKWSKVQIPLEFKDYLELAAASDFMAVDDDTTADRYRGLAELRLGEMEAQLLGQEGQTMRTECLTR